MRIADLCPKFLYQGPRYRDLGPNSGEEFRDDFFIPWLKNLNAGETGTIDFSGTKMYSPSFLEETFGGAVREDFYDKVSKLAFLNTDKFYEQKIKHYIEKAKTREQLNV